MSPQAPLTSVGLSAPPISRALVTNVAPQVYSFVYDDSLHISNFRNHRCSCLWFINGNGKDIKFIGPYTSKGDRQELSRLLQLTKVGGMKVGKEVTKESDGLDNEKKGDGSDDSTGKYKKGDEEGGGGDGGESDRGRAESETIAKKKVAWKLTEQVYEELEALCPDNNTNIIIDFRDYDSILIDSFKLFVSRYVPSVFK